MVICCAICQEHLEYMTTPDEGGAEEGTLARVVAVRCGHIYHYECIRRWWTTLVGNPPADALPMVPCPVCRQENVAQLFELFLVTADDNLFPAEHEMHETIILELNIDEAEEECGAIRKQLDMKDLEITAQEEEMARVEFETTEAQIERDQFLAKKLFVQDNEKFKESEKRALVDSSNNHRESKIPKSSKKLELLEEDLSVGEMEENKTRMSGTRKSDRAEESGQNVRTGGKCAVV